jgi:hypothetical protein
MMNDELQKTLHTIHTAAISPVHRSSFIIHHFCRVAARFILRYLFATISRGRAPRNFFVRANRLLMICLMTDEWSLPK